MNFDSRPLYELDQVITQDDLLGIANGFLYSYDNAKWYQIRLKLKLLVAMDLIMIIHKWLVDGKPGGKLA